MTWNKDEAIKDKTGGYADFESIPDGTYSVKIVTSEYISLADRIALAEKYGWKGRPEGPGLKLAYQIMGGEQDGRYIFNDIGLESNNAACQLLTIMKCTGVLPANESRTGSQLEAGLPSIAKVLLNKKMAVGTKQKKKKGSDEVNVKVNEYYRSDQFPNGPATPGAIGSDEEVPF